MSFISPLDRDLALVYPRLAPVRLLGLLAERGIRVVEVPDEEFESQGPNVLALGPRRALALDGQPGDTAANGARRRRRRGLPRRRDLAEGRRRPDLPHPSAAPRLGEREADREAERGHETRLAAAELERLGHQRVGKHDEQCSGGEGRDERAPGVPQVVDE